jgi:alanine dehydrogenase
MGNPHGRAQEGAQGSNVLDRRERRKSQRVSCLGWERKEQGPERAVHGRRHFSASMLATTFGQITLATRAPRRRLGPGAAGRATLNRGAAAFGFRGPEGSVKMIIGVPRETKTREYRVGITPAGVRSFTSRGHTVRVQQGAGEGSGIADAEYAAQGAELVASAAQAWDAEMVIKVKEPLPSEYRYFRRDLVLYTYLHLAAEPVLTRALAESGVTAVAYETVQLADGTLPLLVPMSSVAGRMAIQVGASFLERERGGKGVLLGGVPGTRRGRVVILGGGIVGRNAATIAIGMGAQVTVLDVRADAMAGLEDVFGGAIETLYSNATNIEEAVSRADLVIGAVLVAGAPAPKLVADDLVGRMQKGSVVVDVAVDQGGCIATCRPTTHDQPTYEVHGIIHYCVPNMPGAVPQTSTWALTNVTEGYALKIAGQGIAAAVAADPALRLGVNVCGGHVTYLPVAAAHGLEYVPVERALGM